MSIAQSLISELDREGASTERILGRVPADKVDWRPHPKSMTLGDLAWHIARIPLIGVDGVRTGTREVGVARPVARAGTDFVGEFRKNLQELKNALGPVSDEVLLNEKFSFVRGGETVASFPKAGFMRTVVMNHSIHHRAQLTVYLRLLDLPVPAMYGRSADEDGFAR